MSKKTKSQLMLIAGIAVVVLLCHFMTDGKFLTAKNMRIVLSHAVFPVLASYGLMFIFSSGMIDLSVGANILLSANVGALLASTLGLGYPGLFVGSVLCAVLAGQVSVQSTLRLGIPAWISGLGSALILEAILCLWSTAQAAKAMKLPNVADFRFFGKVPGMFILLAICVIAAYIIYNRTTLGINLQAMGGNSAVAKVMGIDTQKTLILSTIVGGVFIGFAALENISFSGQLASASGLNSLNTIFKSLAATLLADSIANIFSKPIGILLSGILVVALFNILTLLGVPSGNYQNIALGIVVVFCGILSHIGYKGVAK